MTAKNDNRPVRNKPAISEFKTRVVRNQPADRQFDIDFWQAQGDEAIFAAAWGMICAMEESKRGIRPRFDRTFTRIKRAKG